MTRFFRQLQHLLPDSRAWRVTHSKLLRSYVEGLAEGTSEVAVSFVDDVADDIWPQTTRELVEWEDQFALWGTGTEQERRDALEAAWAATGGQSPRYLQDVVQAAGFDVYVHDWWFGYNIATSTLNDSQSVSANTLAPTGITFSLHGTQAFIIDSITASVDEYSLSPAWDVSSLAYVRTKALNGTDPTGIYFHTNGTIMYIVCPTDNLVRRYNLSTAYNVSTAVYHSQLDVDLDDTQMLGITFVPGGQRMILSGAGGDNVYQYDLTILYDITTATLVATEDVGADGANAPSAVSFFDSGNKLLVCDYGNPGVFEYHLPNPWSIVDMEYNGMLDISTEDGGPWGMHVDYFSTVLLICGGNTSTVYKYDIVQPGAIDPNDYTNKPLFGTTQCGDDGSGANPVAECGEQPPNQTTADSAVCNRFLAIEVWYLWNDDLTQNAPPPVPDESETWPHFVYWGAETFPTKADVPAARRLEFEHLLLKLCPAQQWIVLLVNYV